MQPVCRRPSERLAEASGRSLEELTPGPRQRFRPRLRRKFRFHMHTQLSQLRTEESACICKPNRKWTFRALFGAQAFAHALDEAIKELKNGNISVLGDLSLWFLPTSDWDDLVKNEAVELLREPILNFV